MPISEPQRSFFGGNTYREVTCSKCGYNTKTMGGGKAYASQVLAKHNREKHPRKTK
jgi:hypothetical protein